jgi:glycerol uptake facilitator protein
MNNFLGEFLGVMMLIILGDGVVANVVLAKTKGNASGWIVITTGWAMAVVVGVFTAISAGAPQADINPAVTLGKVFMGTYTITQMLVTWLAQVLGGIAGGIIVWLIYLNHWAPTESQALKLAVFSTGPAIRNLGTNLLTEILGTFVLMFGVGAIFSGATGGNPAPGLGPYLVGALVWGIGLSLGGPTGYAINPARDLGPRIAHFLLPIPGKGSSDWGYSWVPVVGPLIGAALGALLWIAVF